MEKTNKTPYSELGQKLPVPIPDLHSLKELKHFKHL